MAMTLAREWAEVMATKALDMVVAPVAATVADMAAGDLVDLVSHRHK